MQFSLHQYVPLLSLSDVKITDKKKSHFMHIVVSFKLIKLRLKNYHWNALIELILYDVIGTCRRVNLPQIPKILCNNLSMKKILLKIPEDCQTTFLPHMHCVKREINAAPWHSAWHCSQIVISAGLTFFLGIKINQKKVKIWIFYHAACKTHWRHERER